MAEQQKTRAKRKKSPKHGDITVRAFKFPFFDTTPAEHKKLFGYCDLLCEARNILAADRDANRKQIKQQKQDGHEPDSYITRATQYKSITALVKQDRRFAAIHSQVLQNVAERIDVGTKAWLTHIAEHRAGRKSPPGQVEQKDYRSFCCPQYGSAAYIRKGVLHLSRLGDFKIRDYRKLQGKPKSITVKFEHGKWWCTISCEIEEKYVYRTAEEVKDLPDQGGDTGLTTLLAVSDGRKFDPMKPLKDNLSKLRRVQKNMSRKFEMRKKLYAEEQARRKEAKTEPLPPLRDIPYSKRLKADIVKVAKLHTKVGNIRNYNHHKVACILERTIRCLAVEEHGVQFMIRNRKLARTASDRAIAAFKEIVKSKFGKIRYVPTGTSRPGIGGNSQTCLCGAQVPKTLNDRVHNCPNCGLVADRDVVSANIVEVIAFGHSILDFDKSKSIVVAEAGHANADRKVKRRGETEGNVAIATSRAQALEVSKSGKSQRKRHSVLPRKDKTTSGKPIVVADTYRLSSHQDTDVTLEIEADMSLQQLITASKPEIVLGLVVGSTGLQAG
jgi:transposase